MSKNYVPFNGEKNIGPGAEFPMPEFPTLSWCVGALAKKRVIDQGTGEEVLEEGYYKGFFFDCGDKDLDAAAREAGLEKRFIEHQAGEAEHWILPKDVFFLILQGWQSTNAMKRTLERKGLAYNYRYQRDKKGAVLWDRNKRSYAYLQVFPKSLLPYGKPFVVAINSTQTDDLLDILRAQYNVLKFAREYFDSIQLSMELPFYGYGIPMATTKNKVSRKGAGGSREIYPMIPVVPETLTTEYLAAMEMPLEYKDLFAYYAQQSVAWSTDLVTDRADKDRRAEVAASVVAGDESLAHGEGEE